MCLQPIPLDPYLACDSYALLKVPPASHHDVACATVPLVKHCVLEVYRHDTTRHDDPSRHRPIKIETDRYVLFFFLFFDVSNRERRGKERAKISQKKLMNGCATAQRHPYLVSSCVEQPSHRGIQSGGNIGVIDTTDTALLVWRACGECVLELKLAAAETPRRHTPKHRRVGGRCVGEDD